MLFTAIRVMALLGVVVTIFISPPTRTPVTAVTATSITLMMLESSPQLTNQCLLVLTISSVRKLNASKLPSELENVCVR